MTAKTTAERQRAFRAEMKRQGMTEVRGIFAPPELHEAIKVAAKQMSAESEDDDNDLSELGYVSMAAFMDRKLDALKK